MRKMDGIPDDREDDAKERSSSSSSNSPDETNESNESNESGASNPSGPSGPSGLSGPSGPSDPSRSNREEEEKEKEKEGSENSYETIDDATYRMMTHSHAQANVTSSSSSSSSTFVQEENDQYKNASLPPQRRNAGRCSTCHGHHVFSSRNALLVHMRHPQGDASLLQGIERTWYEEGVFTCPGLYVRCAYCNVMHPLLANKAHERVCAKLTPEERKLWTDRTMKMRYNTIRFTEERKRTIELLQEEHELVQSLSLSRDGYEDEDEHGER